MLNKNNIQIRWKGFLPFKEITLKSAKLKCLKISSKLSYIKMFSEKKD